MTATARNGTNQSETNATFNKMFTINCSVESYPLAMVHWEVDGVQVDSKVIGNKTKTLTVDVSTTVNTTVPGVNITYTCVAVNEINGVNRSANNSIEVVIQGKMLCGGFNCHQIITAYVTMYICNRS